MSSHRQLLRVGGGLASVALIAAIGFQFGGGGPSGPLPFDDGLTNIEVLERAGKLVDLPVGEEPIVATIEDAEVLMAQDGFYVGAIDGDKVLVFPTSGRALLYSPSRDLIIKDGSTSLGGLGGAPTAE